MHRPGYYRYVHNEYGDVKLSHNRESHPASVSTLNEMANGEQVDKGFAYRIHGGWRIMNHDHRPVNDPHILRSVVDAIKKVEHFDGNSNST